MRSAIIIENGSRLTNLSPLTFEGGCNRYLFEKWLEKYLIPQLEKGDVIIIDNASFNSDASFCCGGRGSIYRWLERKKLASTKVKYIYRRLDIKELNLSH